MQWYHWQCHELNLLLMSMPMAEHDQNVHHTSFQLFWHREWNGAIHNTISIVWHLTPVPVAWHDQVAPHFDCLDPRNKMSLSMPLAPCDANGITYTKSHVSPLFDHCNLTNAMVQLTTVLLSQRCLDIV